MQKSAWLISLLTGLVLGGLLTFLIVRSPDPADTTVDIGHVPAPSIAAPERFQIETCQTKEHDALSVASPCLLIQAGGKRLLFGAPLSVDWTAIGPLDAVFLFDGTPASSGGLIGLRYETWFDGRKRPLLLVSGALYLETVRALDEALYLPDAISQVEYPNRLDSRQAGFAEKPVPGAERDVLVFNTGDVQVFANAGTNRTGDEILSFRMDYAGKRLDIFSCDSRALLFEGPADAVYLPAMDRARLTDMRNTATEQRLTARLMDIEKLGRSCPSPRQASEFVLRTGASDWIAPADIGTTERTGEASLNAHSLRNGAVVLHE
ncbi:MAG: hypothetical protein CMK09_16225 [Ponticaulis sp.]|nr:hypothetical protein [Ponticaulis sp.]|tara:strand:+ start:20185 stop:21147 length:963 start_codon:yes stop_codon:yes gene_type:complete